ncbi:MAG: hypothetical protein DHS20C15_32310 [Planctomycetota bacterium]|nr:MAG: hypothetical protein DHS20C15_32310 [Planctomycetota bacterium]
MHRTLSLFVALSLALPVAAQTPPASFQWTVSNGANSFVADFEQHSARGPNFVVEVQQADGSFATHTPGDVRTYLGTIAERPGAMASAVRRADGSTHYHVLFEGGAEWINAGGSTTLRNDPNWTPQYPSFVTGSGGAGSDIWAAEIGVDLPHSQYVVDGDVDAALEMIEHSVNTVNLLYLRDAGIVHRLGRVVIRAAQPVDPYAGMTTTNALLTEITNQWNNVLAPSTHDAALVATSATGGGLAAVGVIGSPGYSANGASSEGDFSIVWRHEVGHNWSLNHFDGGTPEGKTINSGNSQSRMSGPEQAKAIAHREARAAFLDNLGPYAEEIPPRASLDRSKYLPQSPAFTIDVLDNDHDANAEAFSITSFDTSTALGGAIALSPGTGPGGRDELLYTPPAVPTAETDRFKYRIADAAGREAVGNVMTKLSSDSDMLAHFSLDAGSGAVASDSSAHLRHASFEGGPTWDSGTINGGLSFDGVDDHLIASAPDHTTANFTITGWVKRDGDQNDWAGLVFFRGGNTTSGLNFGTGIGLRYHWAGEKWDWVPGLGLPDDTWTFVALAVTPSAATVYLDDGTGMRSATNVSEHAPQPFDAELTIGRDPLSSARSFRGSMDDVRVFARTLSAAEIEALAAGLGSAADPSPAQLSASSESALELAWTSSPAATGHRVYLSSTYSDVRDAVATADQGFAASSSWQTPLLNAGAWFWRVDSTDGTHWVEGPVWSFSTDGSSPWSDEGSALAGVNGEPLLVASGSLEGFANCSLDLHDAAPSAPAALFLSLASTPASFKGGTLKPVPWFDILFRSTNPDGSFPIPFVFPLGVPAGTQLWAQWALTDAAAPAGVALSNAVLGVTP